jgi:hypothetical protein
MSSPLLSSGSSRLLITGFIKEDSLLLIDSCHIQDYGRSMFPRSLVPRDAPRRCAQVKQTPKTKDRFWGNRIGEAIEFK